MNVNTEFLEYMYQNIEMGVFSLTKLLSSINDTENKIKKLISEELKEYEKYYKEVKKLIKKTKVEAKNNNLLAKVSATVGIKMDMLKDNSDSSIARMLTQGLTMGVVDITSKLDNYNDSLDKSILKLGKQYKKFQQEEIERLKIFIIC